jgi:hypothetical protein
VKLLMHGIELREQYLVDDGELIAVPAFNARSAFLMVMPGCEGLWRKLVMERLPRVYQLDSQGELIAVFD